LHVVVVGAVLGELLLHALGARAIARRARAHRIGQLGELGHHLLAMRARRRRRRRGRRGRGRARDRRLRGSLCAAARKDDHEPRRLHFFTRSAISTTIQIAPSPISGCVPCAMPTPMSSGLYSPTSSLPSTPSMSATAVI